MDFTIINNYVTNGTKENAKKVLDLFMFGPTCCEEVAYRLTEKLGIGLNEVEQMLRDDADDDVEFVFSIGEDEDCGPLHQPWVEWDKELKFETLIEAKKAHTKEKKAMCGPREWVTDIRKHHKAEQTAIKELRNLRCKVNDMHYKVEEGYMKQIQEFEKKLQLTKAALPAEEEKLRQAEAAFEKKFGYRLSNL